MQRQGWRVILLTLSVFLGIGAAQRLVPNRPLYAVVAAGVTLPIRTEMGFYQALDHLEQRLLGNNVRLIAGDREWDLAASDLGVRLDRVGMWQDVVGRRPHEGYLAFLLRVGRPRSLQVRLTYDVNRLDQHLAFIGAELWDPPRNAYVDLTTGAIVEETHGSKLDVPATRERLLDAWRSGEAQAVAQMQTVVPTTSAQNLRHIGVSQILTRFSSYFDPAQEGRVSNIRTAAGLLNGLVLGADEEFSFNTVVGPRTLERGFHVAPEIINQEMVPGVGGGVCQVSSTLYNVALLTGLDIIERRNHSRPLGYMGIGRDATVYYGAIDLRFRNSLPVPLVFSTEVADNRLTIAVSSSVTLPVEHAVVTEEPEIISPNTIIENDESLPPHETVVVKEGQPGWAVNTWLVTSGFDGQELHRKFVARSIYPPQATVLRQNLVSGSSSSVL